MNDRLVQALGYVGFRSAATAQWEDFAPKILGAMVGDRLPDGALALRMDERRYRICVLPGDSEELAFIGWEVADEAALAQLEERLDAAGRPLRRAAADELAARQVGGMSWGIDPAGNRVEFFFGAQPADTPFAPGRPMSGFLTGEFGLGHLVLQAADTEAALAFYRDDLGFRLSDQLHDSLYFLGCNPRHHSIGIANIGGPPRVLHIMIETLDLDDVGRAFDVCVDEGIRASMIGVHSNDRMTSFYVTTPSGWEIEYGWHGLLVDDASWEPGVIDRPSIWGHRQLDVDHPPTRRRFQQATQ